MIEASASASELHVTLQLSHVDNFWDDTRDGLTPSRALQKFDACLTSFERREIVRYPRVYYAGQRCSAKPPPAHSLLDDAFTNAKGEYVVALHDHIAYRYEIVARIGSGAFGQVLRAVDHATNEEVAVKVVNKAPGVAAAAWSEVKVLRYIQKRQGNTDYGIVHLIEGFLFRGHVCLVCELLGPNLYDEMKLRKFYPMALSTVKRLAAQLLVSLAFLWREKIIHCDLKPENVLVKDAKKANIRLVDFGSACFESGKLYTYVQSRFYRAPEVILGLPFGRPVDLWSYGCLLCELATGSPLFAGEDEVDQLWRIIACLGLPPDDMLAASRRRATFFTSSSSSNNNNKDGTATRTALNGGRSSRSSGGNGVKGGNSEATLGPPPSLLKPRAPSSTSLAAFLGLPQDDSFVSFVAQFLTWQPQHRVSPRAAMEHVWIRDQFVLTSPPPPPPPTVAACPSVAAVEHGSAAMPASPTTAAGPVAVRNTTTGLTNPLVHMPHAQADTTQGAVSLHEPERAALPAPHPPPEALASHDSTVRRVMQRVAALEAGGAGQKTGIAALNDNSVVSPASSTTVKAERDDVICAPPPAMHVCKEEGNNNASHAGAKKDSDDGVREHANVITTTAATITTTRAALEAVETQEETKSKAPMEWLRPGRGSLEVHLAPLTHSTLVPPPPPRCSHTPVAAVTKEEQTSPTTHTAPLVSRNVQAIPTTAVAAPLVTSTGNTSAELRAVRPSRPPRPPHVASATHSSHGGGSSSSSSSMIAVDVNSGEDGFATRRSGTSGVGAETQALRPAAEQPTPVVVSPSPPSERAAQSEGRTTKSTSDSVTTTTTVAAAAPRVGRLSSNTSPHRNSTESPPRYNIPRRATRRRLPSLTAIGPTTAAVASGSAGEARTTVRASSTIVPRVSSVGGGADTSATRRAVTSGTSGPMPLLRTVNRRARQSRAFVIPNSLCTGEAVVASPPVLAPLTRAPPRRRKPQRQDSPPL